MRTLEILEDTTKPLESTPHPRIEPVDDSSLKDTVLFSADSRLLRELGERLVGRAHIALAELVKNSYDADATEVLIRFTPNQIEVIDNGHGMTFADFERFWMRVGSVHKASQRVSQELGRPMTGSKGVGRLAVQFLARHFALRTVSDKDLSQELAVALNWEEAVEAGDLTQASARYAVQKTGSHFAGGSSHGAALILTNLNQVWGAEDFKKLAGEIWWLNPPFNVSSRVRSEQKNRFAVHLESPHDPQAVAEFEEQLTAVLDIWTARLRGRVTREDGQNAIVELLLDFADDGEQVRHRYAASSCTPRFVEFEIRIYNLKGKQPKGVPVQQARDYFDDFGGVHVYDAGFHLPYYGSDQDWLNIERDHAKRQWQSRLLPKELQVQGGLRDLPTNGRIFGVVNVDTAYEMNRSPNTGGGEVDCPPLTIQVTRDRLLDNKAYDDLTFVVRYALDFYAMQHARRKLEELEKKRRISPPQSTYATVEHVLEQFREAIPQPIFKKLQDSVHEANEASEEEATLYKERTGLLGALATAGMSALAIEHEALKQYTLLEDVVNDLRTVQTDSETIRRSLSEIAERIEEWIDRSRGMRGLFTHLLDEEDRKAESRFLAKSVLNNVVEQTEVLLRRIEVDIEPVDDTLRLPYGGFAEWIAIFQNVLLNAVNAMLDSDLREIVISSRVNGKVREILIQDTGSGVDLNSADELFEPFVRRLEISREHRSLGVGGTGLGLTIVRMLAEKINCRVGFVEPEKGFSTAFSLSWREK